MADISINGICVRAAAFTMKYCEKDNDGKPLLIDIPLLMTCIHRGNRGFVYIQGRACKTLLRKLGIDGFLKGEANSKPIMVRERPASDRPDEYESFLGYNIRKSEQDDILAGAYLPTDPVMFSNLAHGHLENMGRAIIRQLHWGHDVFPPELGIHACDASGNLSISALAAHHNLKELKEWRDEGFQG